VRWGDALREAGLEPNLFNQAYDTKMIIEKFVSLIRELGKFPVRRELQLKCAGRQELSELKRLYSFGFKGTDCLDNFGLLQEPPRF